MDEPLKLKSEWFFEEEGGLRYGPFFNDFSPEGLAVVAGKIEEFSSPYLVVGDDTAEGFTVTEIFRKPVSAVTRDAALVRFRTQLLASECNGTHQKWCIFIEASDTPGTGIMLNLLRQVWSKAAGGTLLTVECRITVAQGA